MGQPLRALIVEDRESDALLLLRELRRGGFDVTSERVDTGDAMRAAFAKGAWDIVLADYAMPTFSAPEALKCMQDHRLDLPFIIVSGTVNDEIAVEVMRAGAHDFMAKGNFARLIPAVQRELREATLRSERLKMQEQLLIADRMASVGTLAAGVAHEINNPLASLMVNLQLASAELTQLRVAVRGAARVDDPGVEARLGAIDEHLRDATEGSERVRQIVRDLRIFSRSDEARTGPVDVHRVLDSSCRIAWAEIRHRARLVKDFGEVLPVEGNEGRLGQVFLNLIINAAQAIPEGRAATNEIRLVTRMDENGRVVVEVRDTGVGIAESLLGRIFDPFYTTKPIGVGTGLGLAICHRIITALDGEVRVQSQIAKGTTVRVTLPAAHSDAPQPSPAAAPEDVGPRGRVLVVDDEPMLVRAFRRILASEHDVQVETSAAVALERVVLGERFDVILCDLMMPNVTGMDLHASLLRLAPDQAERMVFMTGGAFTPGAREFLDRVLNTRVEKPIDPAGLRSLLHGVMRTRQT